MARRKKQDEDQPQENLDSSDDTFGLPEIEYEPLKRDDPQEEEPVEEIISEETTTMEEEVQMSYVDDERVDDLPEELSLEDEQNKDEFVEEETPFYEPSYSYSYQDEKPAIWPKVLGALLILAIIGGAVWYFVSYRPEQLAREAKERRELLAIQEDARKKEAQRLAEQQRLEEEQRRVAAAAVEVEKAAPTPGTIETLGGSSGRYYVVVASAIDGDLIMDYAKKLSAQGVTPKIIPPFGKSNFHRLAVAEGDTYADAQATADGMKGGDYGDKIWVIKY